MQLVLGMADVGKGALQRNRIGVAGRRQDGAGRAELDQFPGIHDGEAAAELGNDADIVTDEDQRRAVLALHLLDDVEHLALDDHIEAGGWLVGDQESRFEQEGEGDDRPLAHAPGELVRIGVEPARRQLDIAEELFGAFAQARPVGFCVNAPGLDELGEQRRDRR